MEAQEKKFYIPTLRTYNNNIEKRWRIEYEIPTHKGNGSKRVVRYGKINKGSTIEERTRIANELMASIKPQGPVRKVKSDFLDKTLEFGVLDWKPKTLSAYSTVINKYKAFLRNIPPQAATENTINSFLLSVHKKGASKNTVAKYRNTLFTIYNKAQSLKLCTGNPVVKVPIIKRKPQSLYFFSDTQIQQFREDLLLDAQLWLAIQFTFYCFIRPGELRLLQIGHINFEYSFIEVPGEISKNGKTEKISIPRAFRPAILHLRNYPNSFYVLSKSGQPGTVPVSTKWINDEHTKVLDRLKIRGRYAFYSWKHTGVVKAVKAGINIKDLQLQLRHHSLDMVDEYLKNLGVMDSEDLKDKFPAIGGDTLPFNHKAGCSCVTNPDFNYCPECGVKLKTA